jgi:hypothetical protein
MTVSAMLKFISIPSSAILKDSPLKMGELEGLVKAVDHRDFFSAPRLSRAPANFLRLKRSALLRDLIGSFLFTPLEFRSIMSLIQKIYEPEVIDLLN